LVNLADCSLELLLLLLKLLLKIIDVVLEALLRRLDSLLVLRVLLFGQGKVLVPLILRALQSLTQRFHFLLEILDGEGQLELSLGQRLSQVADDGLALLDLAHVGLGQLLNFVLVGLVELIDLILNLLFANDRLAFRVLEALHNALVVQLHLFLLLLLLLELKAHELILLLGHGTILDGLTLHRFVLVLQVFNDLFKLLNALRVLLVLHLL